MKINMFFKVLFFGLTWLGLANGLFVSNSFAGNPPYEYRVYNYSGSTDGGGFSPQSLQIICQNTQNSTCNPSTIQLDAPINGQYNWAKIEISSTDINVMTFSGTLEVKGMTGPNDPVKNQAFDCIFGYTMNEGERHVTLESGPADICKANSSNENACIFGDKDCG